MESEDKSPKQLKTEMYATKLLRAFKSVVKSLDIHLLRREGSVSVAWKPVAKIEVESADKVSVRWNALAVRDLAIDKDSILEIFNGDTGSTSGVQWV